MLAKPGDFVEHPPSSPAPNVPPSANEFGRLTDEFTRLDGDQTFYEDLALAAVDVASHPDFVNSGILPTAVADSSGGFTPGQPTSLEGVESPEAQGHEINPSWHGKVLDVPFIGDVRFEHLVPYRTQCARGDSGAAVLDLGTTVVLGLHLAGSSEDEFGLFMPLSPVFQRL